MVWQFYIKLNIGLLHSLAIALLGKIPHKGDLLFMFKICMQMCIAVLFVISHGIVRIFMPCKYSYFEIQVSMVIVLGSRDIRMWLDHKGITFRNRICTIRKKTQGRSFMLPTMWRHSKKMARTRNAWTRKPALTRHQICWCLEDFSPSRTVKYTSVVSKPSN